MDFLYISPAFPSNDVLLILNSPGSVPGDVDFYEFLKPLREVFVRKNGFVLGRRSP